MSQVTVQAALTQGIANLCGDDIPDAPRDARKLMEAALGCGQGRLTVMLHDTLEVAAQDQFAALILRRCNREPVSHILGYREFYGRRFNVTADVLDPRPDTETLVAATLALEFDSVLDLGTGSGCILISLLAERHEARGLGTDISQAALDVALQNAQTLDVKARARFVQSDWFSELGGEVFDLIVSNPPYIALSEMPELQHELRHEPQGALSDGADGLSAYRDIISQASQYLNKGGYIAFEIGYTQAGQVSQLCKDIGFVNVNRIQDINGKDRVILAQKA